MESSPISKIASVPKTKSANRRRSSGRCWTFGPGGERLYANRVALDYLGVGLDEWRQRSTGSDIHPEDSERLKASEERALFTGSAYDSELRIRKGDGSYRWFLARFNPVLDDDGKIIRWHVACTDIDDRKRVEEALRNENILLREEVDRSSNG